MALSREEKGITTCFTHGRAVTLLALTAYPTQRMKAIVLLVSLFSVSVIASFAQSRVSLAPTYWFTHNQYSYYVNGALPPYQLAGYGLVSSVGITLRYHFTPHWSVSVGALYYRNADYPADPPTPYGNPIRSTSEGGQLPILVNYRPVNGRLSPYFSVGASLVKSSTYTQRPLTRDGVVGIGLDYRFGSRLSLLVQPTASYSFYTPPLTPGIHTSDYRSYNVGLQAQLIWHL